MKGITTWLNEADYARFKRRVEKLGTTQYAALKKMVKEFLENEQAIAASYLFLCYLLFTTAYVYVFCL